MTDARTQIADLVSTLATRFAHRTLAELPGMREACARLSQADEESLRQLKRWAHKMRGTAASIGLAEISARAGGIEDVLPAEGTLPVDAALAARLNALLASLEADLALAAGPRT